MTSDAQTLLHVVSSRRSSIQSGSVSREPIEASGGRRRRRAVLNRALMCLGLNKNTRQQPAHPLAVRVLDEQRRSFPRRPRYRKLTSEAEAGVGEAIVQQIRIDVARTFSALPRPQGSWRWPSEDCVDDSERVLTRLLVTFEWCISGMAAEAGYSLPGPTKGCTYVQGCNMLAAMCLGFVGGREDDGFWLLMYLVGDVFGQDYFVAAPPLLLHQGDRVAASALVTKRAPRLAGKVKAESLAEATSTLAARCFLSGYVGFLSDEPLLALWEELLQGPQHYSCYPRFSMLAWLAGLIQHTEADLLDLAKQSCEEELVPLFFRCVQTAAHTLPVGWRPPGGPSGNERLGGQSLEKLQRTAHEASEEYRVSFEEREKKEQHARSIKENLARTSTRLSEALKSVETLSLLNAD